MYPTVVSFYTRNSPYQLQAHHLVASCEKFGIPHCIEGVNSWGSWELNCAFKPFFIIEKMKQLRKPLLWVDVDAIFLRRPRLLKVFSHDFAAYTDPELPSDHPSKVRAGTLYINHTQGGRDFLMQWAIECQRQLADSARQEEFWDQMALRDTLLGSSCKVGTLPVSYIHILGHPGDEAKDAKPVIVHLQASRREKRGDPCEKSSGQK